MSFPRYENYKDSGVEWLGDVPKEWSIKRIKHLFEIKKRISGADGYEVLSITQQGIKIKDIESGDGQLSMDYSKYQFVEIGDFAMNHMDLLTGYVDISRVFGVTSPDYRVFSVRDKEVCFDRYYLYLFQMGYRNKIFYAFGQGSSQLGRWRFPTEQFNGFEFPSPSIQEQKQIAAFLDRETTKIDALIVEQQRLIELLKEKRQAIISHAVTKGINLNTPMKNSGIEWLGEVPKHWSLHKLGYACKLQGGYAFQATDFCQDGVAVVRMNNLNRGKLDLSEAVRVPEKSCIAKSSLNDGDLLWGMSGSVGETGSLGNYARVKYNDLPCQLNQRVGRFIIELSILNPDFLEVLIQARYFYDQVLVCVTGTAQFNISSEQVQSCLIALPPVNEQINIAAFLDSEIAKLDTLTTEAKTAVTLLQERRTALISAAVTGKIDVRCLVSEKPEVEQAA